MTEEEEITEKFTLRCNACGSEDIWIDISPSSAESDGDGGTAVEPGVLKLQCRECDNSLFVFV